MNEPDTIPKRRRKGIYLLPNLFTTGTLFGGFYAIVSSMGGNFEHAAIGILFAMIADSLDGRIARMTNTSTDFGKEYDSLCDMAAFGIASSIVVYAFSLHYLSEYRYLGGKLGGVIAMAYATCAALRLARFNVLTAITGSSKDFFGLPSPAAAALVVFFVWTAYDYGLTGLQALLPASIIHAVCGPVDGQQRALQQFQEAQPGWPHAFRHAGRLHRRDGTDRHQSTVDPVPLASLRTPRPVRSPWLTGGCAHAASHPQRRPDSGPRLAITTASFILPPVMRFATAHASLATVASANALLLRALFRLLP